MSRSGPEPIDYATNAKASWFRHFIPTRHQAIGIAVSVVAFMIAVGCWVFVSVPWVRYGSERAYFIHVWEQYTEPPNTLVFQVRRYAFRAGTDAAGREPEDFVWVNEAHAAGIPGAPFGPETCKLLFLHKLQNGSIDTLMNVRLKAVTGSRMRVTAVKLRAIWELRPNADGDRASAENDLVLPLSGSNICVYFGQADPKDASHFTIKYEIDDQPGTIDGWLQADDTVKLQIRDGPALAAATQPAAPVPGSGR